MDAPAHLIASLLERQVNCISGQNKSQLRLHYKFNLKKEGAKNNKMSDLLVFYPQGRHLYIEFLGAKYIERQPKTPIEAHEFSLSIKPVIDQLDAYVEKHGLKEIIELNLKGVPISKLNSDSAIHLLKLMTEIRPDKGLLEKIKITNSNPIFNMVYKGVKGRLPGRVSSLVEFADNDKFF